MATSDVNGPLQDDTSPISPERARRGVRLAIMAQCVGVPLYFSLTVGGLATLYAEKFGAKDLMVGVVNGGIRWGFAVALLLPGMVERYNKRRVLATAYFAAVVVFLPLVFLPQIAAAPSSAAVVIMAVSLLAYGCCSSGIYATWFPLVRDFVPPHRIGNFFSWLRGSWGAASVAAYLVCALVIGKEARLSTFQIILAALLGGELLRAVLITRLPQGPVKPSGLGGVRSRLRVLFSDRNFRRFMFLSLGIRVIARAFQPSMVFYMRRLDFSQREVMMAVVVGMVAGALSYGIWGRLADRHGPGLMYRIGLVLAAAAGLLWFAASYAVRGMGESGWGYTLLLLIFVLQSVCDAVTGIGLTRHSFQLTSHERAATYLNLHPTLMTMAVGVAIFLIGGILKAFTAVESVGWLNPYVIVFAGNVVLAGIIFPFIRRVPKSETAS